MKWIYKYQKAGKLNFKTTGLPWQQSKQDQEITRNAQSLGLLNPTTLKIRLQPAIKNLKAKYNNLTIKERLALAKRSMPHSEIVTVKDQYGNTKTSTNPQAGAMSGADPVGKFVVGIAAGNLGLGLGKIALSKMGQNTVSHWARNSLLNETAGNLTRNVSQGITNNLAAKEYTTVDNPIMQLFYYKPTRKAWNTGKAEGANLSTWGSVSKGGIHGINRFGKDFGFIQNGTRQLTMKGTKEPIEVGIFQKPKLDQGMVRLYRASGTNGKFTPSPDGTAKYAGMWFTDNPRKTLIYASYTRRRAIKEGVDNPIELQYIDIPKTQLNQYKASNIIGNDPNIDYEITEDFLIPLNMKRNRIPLKGITGNILRDSKLTIPKLDPNVFKIAAPIVMSLPFLNNSQK